MDLTQEELDIIAGCSQEGFAEALLAVARYNKGVPVLRKTYDGESLYDLERDVSEALRSTYNKVWDSIPSDEHGIPLGDFHVSIVWEENKLDSGTGAAYSGQCNDLCGVAFMGHLVDFINVLGGLVERIGIIGREKSQNRLAELLNSTWSRLTCHVRGHLYRPMFEVKQKPVVGRGRVGTIKVVRYTCECCGEKTAWMGKGKHKEFELDSCPTWGDRGSDSQNYLGKGVYDVGCID